MNTESPSLHVGIWQDCGVPGNVIANLATISRAAVVAARQGIELLVFPECFLTGYFNPDGIAAIARQAGKESVDRLRGLARTNGIALLVGLYESRANGIHNAAILIGADGSILATYRKRLLYGAWERAVFAPGNRAVLAEYRGIRIAILICFDLEFPELARECASNGADLIAVPTALMAPHGRVARHVVPARAIENQVYIAYGNRTGREHNAQYVGNSSICDPYGFQLAKGKDSGPELLSACVERSTITAAREEFCYIEERKKLRPESISFRSGI